MCWGSRSARSAQVALHHGDLAQAAALPEEGLAHVRAVGDDDAIAALLGNLGNVAFFRGDYAEAVTRAEESLALYRALGSVHGTASVLGTLGRALLEQGEHERAQAVLGEGLVLSQRIGNKWYAISALEGLAARRHRPRSVGTRGAVIRRGRGAGEGERHRGATYRPGRERASGGHRPGASRRGNIRGCLVSGGGTPPEAALADAPPQAIAEELTPAATDKPRACLATEDDADEVSVTERALFPGLTARECDVLALLAKGQSDGGIAAALAISERTAGNHVQHIMHKLGVTSRTAAAIWALRHQTTHSGTQKR